VVVTAAALIAVPPAFGSTASVEDHLLEYVAAPGEVNAVDISEQGQIVTIVDAGAVITPGTGCSQVSDHEVTCLDVGEAGIFLSDLGDEASLLLQESVSFGFYGQEGNDDLSLCSQCSGTLIGGPGDDTLEAGDFFVGSALRGGSGADTLTGGAGEDDLRGGRGNDTVDGAQREDFIFPGGGKDVLKGGSGRDRLFFVEGGGAVVVDLVLGTATGQGTKTLVGIENVFGTDGADELYGNIRGNFLSGLRGDDLLVGRRGEDLLVGGSGRGNDRLHGGPGADRLFDDHGSDLLIGGRGGDRLFAGPGKDRMFGWAGNDFFGARDGFRDIVGGGDGTDSAEVDGLDATRNIETFF
jgi:Ca2+-binding RTX toxin-like protein